MARFGIIDLGSNTIRLCIYEVNLTPGQPLGAQNIDTLLNYKIMAGLASYVQKGEMTKSGIRKAIKTIGDHLRRAAYFNCERIDIFATAVLRNCTNSRAALAEIEQALDKRITVLSNEEEAHLGFLGASIGQAITSGTLVDIGGGSTELTLVKNGLDLDKISLPQGSLSSFSLQVGGIMPTPDELKAINDSFCALAKKPASPFKTERLFGIGGAIRSAAKVYGDLCNNGQRLSYLEPTHLQALFTRYKTQPEGFAHEALRTVPDRIHTFLPGCVLIQGVFTLTKAKRLDICKFGVREGYLAERVLVKPIARS